MSAPVTARFDRLTLPTHRVGSPARYPLFLDRRVYQGSSGKVYPLPFVDRVEDAPVPVDHPSVVLENEYIRLEFLPEMGGRVFSGLDKTRGGSDFIYRQDVIKPALVGLAGPWISGGIEFNWPQHHRPGTFMPSDVTIEEESDGAKTVWLGEHDPISHLKGLYGFRLRPDSALIEIRVRLFNRTPLAQTFLWWTNIAARVHDNYQAFFPDDVRYVADHAVRAQSSFPIATGTYYGVRYQDRPQANDLTWYRNIPVPTSYMVCDTAHNFCGGYDHDARAGFVHVASHHISPGKKLWTWGNDRFGRTWDRELTDQGGPYIEVMAGVYTDNQPDFSYLAPYETRCFSQFLWPFRETGPLQQANTRAGLRLGVAADRRISVGVVAPNALSGARLILRENERTLVDSPVNLRPGGSHMEHGARLTGDDVSALSLVLLDATGNEIVSHRPPSELDIRPRRPVAVEPAAPREVASSDQLFLIGEHLEKYRHPTRAPELYWLEGLSRDPEDSRCNLALGRQALARGRFSHASDHLEKAIARLTERSRNPVTGEAHYHLGLVRRWQQRVVEAYDLLYKATWNHAWRAAAFYVLATIDCERGDFRAALGHLEESLDDNRRNTNTQVLKAAILRRTGQTAQARDIVEKTLHLDPLSHWALNEAGILTGNFSVSLNLSRNDGQTALDVAFDYSDAGLHEEAIELLHRHLTHPVAPCQVPNPLARTPSVLYALAWLESRRGGSNETVEGLLRQARSQSPDHFFPSRLHEQVVLEWALAQSGADPLAAYALGNYLHDRSRHADAIAAWGRSLADGATFAAVHRNLGLAYWNVQNDGIRARAAYVRAREIDPADARLLYEFDQLRKRLGEPLVDRLTLLELKRERVLERDDTAVELASLYNLLDRSQEALALIESRRFHPWEGGEGRVLAQYTIACHRLAEMALEQARPDTALAHVQCAVNTPSSLGEARHPLQSMAEIHYWQGRALQAAGREEEARASFAQSAGAHGDFKGMAVVAHSPLTYFSALSLRALGREDEAVQLLNDLIQFAESRIGHPQPVDFFATSLPNLLVFDEDHSLRWDADHHLLAALGCLGLDRKKDAQVHLECSLAHDICEPYATFIMREIGGDRHREGP